MKAFLAILAASASALCAADDATAHVPMLLWSQRSTFDKPSTYSSAVLDEAKVSSKLQSLLQADHDVALFLPATLDAQVLSQMGGDKTSFVESAVKDATSSLVLAHTTREGSLEDALKDADVPATQVDDVDAFVASAEGQKLLTDDKAELLIVKVPKLSPTETDAWIKDAAAKLSKAGKVDFALTGNQATTSRTRRLAAAPAANITCDVGYFIGTDSAGKQFCFGHYVRMTPNLLSGIVIGFFFVFLGYIGFSAMHSIQTPAKYPHHGPPKGKEF